nr:hypothetical protein [Tanacetum cinerariifolium]
MNRLVRHNLVRGLPSKCFDNDHTFVACLKGKQHKASCKTKLVNSVTKPLHTLHMDLFGPTSDETSGILRNFITEIENLKGLKVKIIRCDNGGEFRNKEMNDLCSRKGIKREFSNARTPQQNGVAERRNKTLIEATKTMLAYAKLPVTFWDEAVNTACYVQNRVLVNKSQNKTPYELFNGRTPAIGFLKPFGCHVMIFNTLDHLGKFDAKGDEGYFIGYSMSSKAFRVFNKRTKRVEENLHVDFLENNAIKKGADPNWLFDIDSLTNSMNYVPVVVAESSTSNAQDTCNADASKSNGNSNPTATSTNPSADHMETLAVETPIPTVSSLVPTDCLDDSPQLDPEFPARVYKVEKAMYGLYQAPRAWYGTLSKYLLTNCFQRGTIDQILFIRRQRGDFIHVQVYVDDIILGSSNPQLCREFEALMHEKFQMSAMGKLNFFLGLQVLQKKDGIFLSQDKHQVTPKECHLHAVKRIFRYLKVEKAMRGSVSGNYIIYTTIKYELNIDFHQIEDFVEASHLRYALTFNPTVYVSHIRQFWSTARIETMDEGTKILATVDGKLRTISESSIRRNLKLKDEAGISSLPDA